MPHNKHPGKQGCNCHFRNLTIFNPRKHRSVNTHPSVFVHVQCIRFQALSVASLSAVIYQLLFNILPVVFIVTLVGFCSIASDSVSVLFGLFCSTIPCLIVCCAPSMQPPQRVHIASVMKQCSGYELAVIVMNLLWTLPLTSHHNNKDVCKGATL